MTFTSLKAFAKEAVRVSREERVALIEAVYVLVDRAAEELYRNLDPRVPRPVCTKGCCECCMQETSLTQPEGELILSKIKHLPKQKQKAIIDVVVVEWEEFARTHPEMADPLHYRETIYETTMQWVGRPCPLLDTKRGECNIYEARPIVCRQMVSTAKCESGVSRKGKFRETAADRFAINFAIEMEMNRLGTRDMRDIPVYMIRQFIYLHRDQLTGRRPRPRR